MVQFSRSDHFVFVYNLSFYKCTSCYILSLMRRFRRLQLVANSLRFICIMTIDFTWQRKPRVWTLIVLLPPLPQKRQLAGAASGPHRGPAGGGHFAWTQARWHPGLDGRPSHVRRQVPGLASNGRRLSTGRWSVVAIFGSPLMGVGHMELISCYKSHVRLFVFRVVSHPPSASERRLC